MAQSRQVDQKVFKATINRSADLSNQL